jgi:hypothetical protein
MTRRCAVPHCRNRSRIDEVKCSVFRVPQDLSRRKKWEEAIPGIIELRSTDLRETFRRERYISRMDKTRRKWANNLSKLNKNLLDTRSLHETIQIKM